MGEIKNEFSWSLSRLQTFNYCKRQYYYQYYGFWGGWKADAEWRVRQTYVLKKLQNMKMWAGSIVHDIIKNAIDNYVNGLRPFDKEKSLTETHAVMQETFKKSRAKTYWEMPTKVGGLFEHEYDLPVPNDAWRAISDHAQKCVSNFFDSSYFHVISHLRKSDIIRIIDFDYFMLDDIKVFGTVDFAYRGASQFSIIDWKTGLADKKEDHKLQLGIYALFAMRKWNAELQNIHTFIYNLARAENEEYPARQEVIDEVSARIRETSLDMRSLLYSVKNNEAKENKFEQCNNTAKCRYCNFYKICFPDGGTAPTLKSLWTADDFVL